MDVARSEIVAKLVKFISANAEYVLVKFVEKATV